MMTFFTIFAVLLCGYSAAISQEAAQPEQTVDDRLNEFGIQALDYSGAIFINQVGNDNQTSIRQIGTDNTAAVAINGNQNGNNSSELFQENALNSSVVIVDGDNNNFNVNQTGNAGTNTMRLGQVGDFNIATIEQSALPFATNTANLTQVGTRNNVTMEQYATVSGLGNQVNLFQAGIDNDAILYQDGGNNNINAAQLGNNVDATLTQFGVDNNLSTLQAGDNLNLGITQYGNTSMTIIQTNFFTIGN